MSKYKDHTSPFGCESSELPPYVSIFFLKAVFVPDLDLSRVFEKYIFTLNFRNQLIIKLQLPIKYQRGIHYYKTFMLI